MFKNKKLIGAVFLSLIFQIIVVYAPPFQKVFRTTSLTLIEWIALLLVAATAFLVPLLSVIFRKFFKKQA